jgi:hypothetical protein
MKQKFIASIVIVALLLAVLIIFLHNQNPLYSLVPLIIGDIALALVSIISFTVIEKGINSGDGNAFVRAKMSAAMIKFFICIALLLSYIFINKMNNALVHKPSLFLFIGMYAVFSALEAIPLSSIAKKK